MSQDADIIIDKIDECKMAITASDSVYSHIYDYFSFWAKNYKFMPKYEAGLWDGKIRLLNMRDKTMDSGILLELIRFALDFEYSLDVDPDFNLVPNSAECPVDLEELVESFNLPYEPYDYQMNAWEQIFKHKNRFLLSPTSSGKSLIIYGAMRHLVQTGKKVLIVCPTQQLVDQMVGDFCEYSENNKFDAESTCHKIYEGQTHSNKNPVTVSTWQSIHRKQKKWFQPFDAVFIDEAHLADGTSLTGIMGKCTNAEYRIGLTGTISEAKVHKYTLISLFGPIYETITTKAMIDRGITAQLKIKALVMDFPDHVRSEIGKLPWKDELDWIIANEKLNKFVCNLAIKQDKNTLILYRFVERHGLVLYEMLKEMCPDRQIYFVAGSGKHKTPKEERRRIQALAEKNDGVIIVASYGTFSTGISIKNLHNIILAHPLKGRITLLQSIGRVLRKFKGYDLSTVYDIACDLSWKSRINTTWNHFKKRMIQYKNSGFDYKIIKVKM